MSTVEPDDVTIAELKAAIWEAINALPQPLASAAARLARSGRDFEAEPLWPEIRAALRADRRLRLADILFDDGRRDKSFLLPHLPRHAGHDEPDPWQENAVRALEDQQDEEVNRV